MADYLEALRVIADGRWSEIQRYYQMQGWSIETSDALDIARKIAYEAWQQEAINPNQQLQADLTAARQRIALLEVIINRLYGLLANAAPDATANDLLRQFGQQIPPTNPEQKEV